MRAFPPLPRFTRLVFTNAAGRTTPAYREAGVIAATPRVAVDHAPRTGKGQI